MLLAAAPAAPIAYPPPPAVAPSGASVDNTGPADIVNVDRATGSIADGSDQVRLSATELSRVAEQLQTTARLFKV